MSLLELAQQGFVIIAGGCYDEAVREFAPHEPPYLLSGTLVESLEPRNEEGVAVLLSLVKHREDHLGKVFVDISADKEPDRE
jgi:hypothetical protein